MTPSRAIDARRKALGRSLAREAKVHARRRSFLAMATPRRAVAPPICQCAKPDAEDPLTRANRPNGPTRTSARRAVFQPRPSASTHASRIVRARIAAGDRCGADDPRWRQEKRRSDTRPGDRLGSHLPRGADIHSPWESAKGTSASEAPALAAPDGNVARCTCEASADSGAKSSQPRNPPHRRRWPARGSSSSSDRASRRSLHKAAS